MRSSITFQTFGPVAPNLHNIVFDDVIIMTQLNADDKSGIRNSGSISQ